MEFFMTKMTAKEKMLNALTKTGGYNTFTVAQARARFGVKNVAARINELREEGYPIYTNTRKLSDGRTISFYRLGQPTRRMIAEGIKSLRSQGVSTFA
jgi:biotin operon repressor